MEPGPILVLGATGFIGGHAMLQLGPAARAFSGDLRNVRDVRTALSGCQTVVHAIGNIDLAASHGHPSRELDECVAPTVKMAQLAYAEGVEQIVFLSSGGAVYGEVTGDAREDAPTEPLSSYGLAKLTIERYLQYFERHYGLIITCLRLGNVYGPNQRNGIVPRLFDAIETGAAVSLCRDSVRDYVYVTDVIAAIQKAIAQRQSGTFNIGTGKGTSLMELVSFVERVTDGRISVQIAPRRPYEVARNVLGVSKARHVLDWQPTIALEEGIQMTFSARRRRKDH